MAWPRSYSITFKAPGIQGRARLVATGRTGMYALAHARYGIRPAHITGMMTDEWVGYRTRDVIRLVEGVR